MREDFYTNKYRIEGGETPSGQLCQFMFLSAGMGNGIGMELDGKCPVSDVFLNSKDGAGKDSIISQLCGNKLHKTTEWSKTTFIPQNFCYEEGISDLGFYSHLIFLQLSFKRFKGFKAKLLLWILSTINLPLLANQDRKAGEEQHHRGIKSNIPNLPDFKLNPQKILIR